MSDKDIIDMKEENGQWSAYVSYIDAEARAKADAKLAGWFGEGTC